MMRRRSGLNRKPNDASGSDESRRETYAKPANYAKIRSPHGGTLLSSGHDLEMSRVATLRTTFPADNDAAGGVRERFPTICIEKTSFSSARPLTNRAHLHATSAD